MKMILRLVRRGRSDHFLMKRKTRQGIKQASLRILDDRK